MERLIDPVLTDLQNEYGCAIAQGRVWRSRWLRMAGYVAFFKVTVLYGCERAVRGWSEDDGETFARTFALSAAAMVAAGLLLISPVIRTSPAFLLVYSIPQALPLAIPVGVAVGTFCGLGGRVVSLRLKVAVLAMSLACSVGSLAAMAWIVPAAGQAFRVSLAEHAHRTVGKEATLTTGPAEMTTSELRRRIESLSKSGRTRARAAFSTICAGRCRAPRLLALFALSVVPRRPVRHWMLAAAASRLPHYTSSSWPLIPAHDRTRYQ
jgi:hypothetical protein